MTDRSTPYYQLGGYRIYKNRWDSPFKGKVFDYSQTPKLLAEKVFSSLATEDSEVTLVLGIERSGASRLLLTEEEVRRVCIRNGMSLPVPQERLWADSFESLSPIEFFEAEELAGKLSALAPKSRAKFDNSKDNKSFDRANEGEIRGTFENGRILRQVATGRLTGSNLNKFSLYPDISLLRSTRVISLAYTLWASDHRPIEDRNRNPTTRLLDLGVSEATLEDLRPIPGTSKNLILSNNSNLKQPRDKHLSFEAGETEMLDPHAVSSRLRELLSIPQQGELSRPTILLVHDSTRIERILEVYGFETYDWKHNLKELRNSQHRSRYGHTGEKKFKAKQYNRFGGRSRSASPRRSGKSPERSSRQDGAVYLIDIKQLFQKMMKSNDDCETINSISKALEIIDEKDTGWNAGRDAQSLLSIWQTMVDGRSIDEQHTRRRDIVLENLKLDRATSVSTPQAQASRPAQYNFDDDDSHDPNDQPQASTSSNQPVYDDDWSDYSED